MRGVKWQLLLLIRVWAEIDSSLDHYLKKALCFCHTSFIQRSVIFLSRCHPIPLLVFPSFYAISSVNFDGKHNFSDMHSRTYKPGVPVGSNKRAKKRLLHFWIWKRIVEDIVLLGQTHAPFGCRPSHRHKHESLQRFG